MLELDGHVVFVVSVGPVSSNWERAIEVYYQLKGGQADRWTIAETIQKNIISFKSLKVNPIRRFIPNGMKTTRYI
jgi:hypothetical protein